MSTAEPAVLRDSGTVMGRLRPALRQTKRLSRKNPTMVGGIAVVTAMIIIAAIPGADDGRIGCPAKFEA